MSTSARPLVEEGDLLRVTLDDHGDGAKKRITALVLAVKKATEEKQGSWFKYTLREESSGDIIKTRLAHLKWKKLKKDADFTKEEDEGKCKKKRKENSEAKIESEPPTSSSVAITKQPSSKRVCRPTASHTRGLKNPRTGDMTNFPMDALKYILAPMVGASELPFRLLCRKYGATLAYTPMIHSDKFAVDEKYRAEEFQVTPEDRPLVAHFAANDPPTLLAAARHVIGRCDAIDLNLGCPQRVACAGHFGSFLLDPEDRPLVLSMVRTLAENLPIPVFAKIRLLDKLEDTMELVQQLYEAGAAVIAIHGRYRVNLTQRSGPGARDGPAMLDQIQQICEKFPHIPIIANGNIITFADVVANRELTKAIGVMSAEGILDNPAIFNGGQIVPATQLATEYLALVEKYPTKLKSVVFHIRRMCKDLLLKYQLMEDCINAESVEVVKEIVRKVIAYEKDASLFHFDQDKAKREKEALARRKEEEGKRKEYEARMVRKAKREGKPLDFYLKDGADPPTEETILALKAMKKEAAFEYWKDHHKQHCWSYHFDPNGCHRDRKCSFLHLDVKHSETEVYG